MAHEGSRSSRPDGTPITLLYGFAGAVVGAFVGGIGGRSLSAIALGVGLGLLAARLRLESARIDLLSQSLAGIGDRLAALERGAPSASNETSGVVDTESSDSSASPQRASLARRDVAESGQTAVPARAAPRTYQATGRPRPAPRGPGPVERGIALARGWLFGGNTVVRGGVLVLLVGITLLARWAAENSRLPIEARLGAAALMGLALVVLGFRLRSSRPGFGTTLQGGGLAALYVVSFVAFRLFELVPVGIAFALFLVIAVASGTLAVVQRALPLIVIASLGGFLAPILASTGSGNHVALFSYYLILNVSIAAIAFVRSWRVLNLLAFICTYGVATAWGVLSYAPEHLMSTLPFVFAFLFLFTGAALLFAWRQPPNLRGAVDGTLVFGTPLVSLLASATLLQDVEMGLAFASAGMGLLYAGIAFWLWRVAPGTLRQLSEAFVALAIGFGTMAVPFAFEDSPTTAIVWALEGAGIHWVGVRQSRRMARVTGLLLQILAAVAYLLWVAITGDVHEISVANGHFLSAAAMAFAGLSIAREADNTRTDNDGVFWALAQAAGVWGIAWWGYGVSFEIANFVPDDLALAAGTALIGVSTVFLCVAANKLAWDSGKVMTLVALPVAAGTLLASTLSQPSVLIHYGFLAWPLCLASIYWVVFQLEPSRLSWGSMGYAAWLWLLGAFAALAFYGLADHTLELGGDWALAGLGLGLGGVAAATLFAIERERGAFGRLPRVHFSQGAAPLLFVGLLWVFATHFVAQGAVAPLPYLPLLNPIDLVVGLIALSCGFWALRLSTIEAPGLLDQYRPAVLLAGVVLVFGWLNAILVRSVVQWGGIAHRADDLWNSVALQVCLSITWTLVGFAGMWFSTRHGLRKPWMSFACLLGVTVAKLFVVDLSQLTTPAKIGTFLVVGVLLLIVGYLSPVPPDAVTDDEGQDVSATSVPRSPSDGTGSLGVLLAVCLASTAMAPNTASAADVAPLDKNDFGWSRAIEQSSSGLIQVVELPFDIYRNSVEPGLADLRVFDAAGASVPHAIATPAIPKVEATTLTPLPLFQLPQDKTPIEILRLGGKYRVDLGADGLSATLQVGTPSLAPNERANPRAYLVDASQLDVDLVGVELSLAESDSDYLIPFRLEATNDFAHYSVLAAAAVVARLSGEAETIEQRRVRFPRTRPKYLKLSWPSDEKAPAIIGVHAVQSAPEKKVKRLSANVDAEPIDKGSFLFDAQHWPPVDQIQVSLGETRALVSVEISRSDKRDGPWSAVHRGLVFNFGSHGEPGSQNEPVAINLRRAGFVRVDIASKGGDASMHAPALTVDWPPQHLYFVDQGTGPYTLVYGKAGAPAARFDAAELLSVDRRAADHEEPIVPTAKLGERVELKGNAALVPDTSYSARTLVLWAVLVGAVSVVGALAIRLVREMRD